MTFALFFLAEYANMILISDADRADVPRRLAVALRGRAAAGADWPGSIFWLLEDRRSSC
jgi:hypothetical protein